MMNNPEDSPLYALAEDISIAINQNHDGNRLRKIQPEKHALVFLVSNIFSEMGEGARLRNI